MYKVSQKPKLIDLVDRNSVYRCINDVHCQNGTFEKGSLVFLDLVKLNKTKPYKYALKLYDCKDTLDISNDDTVQDIAPNINGINFHTVLEVAEDINDKIDNSDYIADHNSYIKFISKLDKVCVFIFSIFALLLTFGCGSVVADKIILTTFFEDLTRFRHIVKLSFILSALFLLTYIICKVLLTYFSKSEKSKYLEELNSILDESIDDMDEDVDETLLKEIHTVKNNSEGDYRDRYDQFLEDFMNVVNEDIDDKENNDVC